MPKFILLLFLGLILRLVLSVFIYSGDVNNHMGWGESILREGSRGAYDRQYTGIMQPTYPPLSLHSFVTADWLYKNTYSIAQSLNHSFSMFPSRMIWLLEDQDVRPAFHKIISIVSDLGISVLIYILARRMADASARVSLTASAVYLFNPAVWYNSSLWGQLESPPVFFILLSLYLILKRQPLWAHLAFACAMLFKQSSLIFFPAFIIFSFFKSGLKKTLSGLASQFVLFYISYLPFFHFQLSTFNYPLLTYLHRIEVGSGSNYITDHAFNLWALYTHLEKIPDTRFIIAGYTANLIGKAGFIFLSLLILHRQFFSKNKISVINSMGITSIVAFMLLTRMHERYLAPALPFMAIAAAGAPQLWPVYLLISLGHWINLYHNWWYPTLIWLRPVMLHPNTINFVIGIFILGSLSWLAIYYDQTRKQ